MLYYSVALEVLIEQGKCIVIQVGEVITQLF